MEKILERIIKNIKFKHVNNDEIANNNLYYNFRKYIFYLFGLIQYQEIRHFTFFQNTETLIKKEELDFLKKKLKSIEGMSTIANAWIINQISQNLKPNQNYLNIGCWKGFSLIAGMINTNCNVYGVDNFAWKDYGKKNFYNNFDKFKDSNKHFFHEGDYVEYLKKWEKKKEYIDFYFYDGPHTFKDQYQSLELGSQFFKSGTLILVDDTNWKEPREATMEFIKKNSNKYRVLQDLKCKHARHPTYWNGLIIFEKT